MLKLWVLLLACALIVCQISQAAPSSFYNVQIHQMGTKLNKSIFRNSNESMTDGETRSDDPAQRLLRAIKEFMQIASDEQEHQADDGNSATTQKRACNTATCVTHRLADFLSRSGGLGHSNYVPTNVGAQAFGRRKRHGSV